MTDDEKVIEQLLGLGARRAELVAEAERSPAAKKDLAALTAKLAKLATKPSGRLKEVLRIAYQVPHQRDALALVQHLLLKGEDQRSDDDLEYIARELGVAVEQLRTTIERVKPPKGGRREKALLVCQALGLASVATLRRRAREEK